MNQNLLFIAKAIGDLKVSINGEGCVGFAVNHVWTNFMTFELMGDQGNFYPTTALNHSALRQLGILFECMDVVPYSNDQTYSVYVNRNIKKWLNTGVIAQIKEGFAQHPDVCTVVAKYTEKKRVIASVTVEITTNKYVQAIHNIIGGAQFIAALTQPTFFQTDEGDYFIDNGVRYPLNGVLLYKQCGVESLPDSRYYYRLNVNQNDTSLPTHILTRDKFDFRHPRGARILTV